MINVEEIAGPRITKEVYIIQAVNLFDSPTQESTAADCKISDKRVTYPATEY